MLNGLDSGTVKVVCICLYLSFITAMFEQEVEFAVKSEESESEIGMTAGCLAGVWMSSSSKRRP